MGFKPGQGLGALHEALRMELPQFCPGCSLVGWLRPPCSTDRVAPGGRIGALLSTCRTMVASACPRGLVALQMYWPESCWATRGMISVSPSSLCCQGSGERSLDQWMVGVGLPVEWSRRRQRSLGCLRDSLAGAVRKGPG